ncbi:MAG: hypothetical protein AB1733_17910 [Thermodesulfobacteriota bacterium]
MARLFLSAIAIIVTNLIVGSISLSLGLILGVVLIFMVGTVLVLFAALGMSTTLERVGWLKAGWTDDKILRLKSWAGEKWRNLPGWYVEQKRRMIELLIESLKGKEEAADSVKIWKSVVIGLVVLLAIVLVKQNFQLSIGWSIVVVAIGSVVVAVPALYITGKGIASTPSSSPPKRVDIVPSPESLDMDPDELREALRELIVLKKSGKLTLLGEASPLEPLSGEATPSGTNQPARN